MKNWKHTFAIIWSGQLMSILSSNIVGYAIIFWISIETGSPETLALAALAALLPQSVLGLFTGVFIDRWNRRFVMIFSDLFIATATFVLVILFYLGKAEIWHIYLLAAVRSTGQAFHMPAMQASIPLLAPQSQLMRIAGINQMIYSVSGIAGPAIGAILISFASMTWVLMIDVVGAIFAAGSLLFVKIPNPEKQENAPPPHVFRELKEGLAEIGKDKGLLLIFTFSVICTFFIMPIAVLFPLMTLNHFGGGVMQMSIVEIFWGAGMLAGGAIMGARKWEVNKAVLLNWMYFAFGISFLIPGILPPTAFIWFVVFTTLGGISSAIYNAAFNTLIQIKISPEKLGRVFSTYTSLTLLPSMIGILGAGFVAERIGLVNAFIICGIINLMIGLASVMTPAIKRTGEI